MSDTRAERALAHMVCTGWRPVRRDNPASTLRGRMDIELRSGLIIDDLSVLSTGRRHWVAVPSRLRLDPKTNRPVPGPYCWDPCIEFRDEVVRHRFSDEAIAALLRFDPRALDEVPASIPA